jgi:hypothetical protein
MKSEQAVLPNPCLEEEEEEENLKGTYAFFKCLSFVYEDDEICFRVNVLIK